MADFTCDPTYLAPTGFKVALDRKNYPNIQFFAQQVQINVTKKTTDAVNTISVYPSSLKTDESVF